MKGNEIDEEFDLIEELKNTDTTRDELKGKKLKLEEMRSELEIEERKSDSQERKEESEVAVELE